MGKTVTSRLPENMVNSIKEIAETEMLDTSSTIRRLLKEGIRLWKIDHAIEQFQNNEISIGKAAEMCKMPILDFLTILSNKKIPIHYDIDDFMDDLHVVDLL